LYSSALPADECVPFRYRVKAQASRRSDETSRRSRAHCVADVVAVVVVLVMMCLRGSAMRALQLPVRSGARGSEILSGTDRSRFGTWLGSIDDQHWCRARHSEWTGFSSEPGCPNNDVQAHCKLREFPSRRPQAARLLPGSFRGPWWRAIRLLSGPRCSSSEIRVCTTSPAVGQLCIVPL